MLQAPDLFAKFSPDQPRDARGRWAPEGKLAGRRPARWEIRQALMGHGQSYGRERAVVQLANSGKVIADVGGSKTSVSIVDAAFMGFRPWLRRKLGHETITFHNHPDKARNMGIPPSPADLAVAIQNGGRHVVYAHSGSIFHFKSNLSFPLTSRESRIAGNLPAVVDEIMWPFVVGTSEKGEGEAALSFAQGHGLNLALRDKGWIQYNFRFSPKDKKKADRWAPTINRAKEIANKYIPPAAGLAQSLDKHAHKLVEFRGIVRAATP